jgi:CRISPR-associated protein (TIGR03984 family)
MNREIKPIAYTLTPQAPVADLLKAVQDAALSGRYRFLLAHALDEVIWGLVQDGKLVFAEVPAAPNPRLQPDVLQQVRLFGPDDEWFGWRTPTGWSARQVHDSAEGEPGAAITENWILWGTDLEKKLGSFSLMREADLGIRHAPPLPFADRHKQYVRVRHYVRYDSAGAAYIQLSRLVDLNNGGEE